MYITEKKNNQPINFNFDMIQSRNIKDFSSNSPLSGFIYLTIYLFICLVASLIQILAIQKIIFFQELLCMYLLYNDVSDYVLRMEKSIFNMVFAD